MIWLKVAKDLVKRTEYKFWEINHLKLLIVRDRWLWKRISWNCFDKKSAGSGAMSIKQLADGLYKPITRKFKRHRVYSSFKYNIWGDDLADMQLTTKHNEGFRFLLCRWCL